MCHALVLLSLITSSFHTFLTSAFFILILILLLPGSSFLHKQIANDRRLEAHTQLLYCYCFPFFSYRSSPSQLPSTSHGTVKRLKNGFARDKAYGKNWVAGGRV